MTDKEALEIISKAKVEDIDLFSKAVYIAAKRLEECQWHDYVEEFFRSDFGMKVILGIRYGDGSRGSVNGHVMYDMKKGYYLAIDSGYSHYTDNAVIEKWMKYPKYD